jgi:hypothetical protein
MTDPHGPPETEHRFTLYGGMTCEACMSGQASTGPCRPRRTCTSANPMIEDGGRWEHPEARVTREADNIGWSTGNYTHYRCPACGTEFKTMEADS